MTDVAVPPSPLSGSEEGTESLDTRRWRGRVRSVSVALLLDSIPAAFALTVYWIGSSRSLAQTLAGLRARPLGTVVAALFWAMPPLVLGLLGLTLIAVHGPSRPRAVRTLLILAALAALLDGADAARWFCDFYSQGRILRESLARIGADALVLAVCVGGGRRTARHLLSFAAGALVVWPAMEMYSVVAHLPHVAHLPWLLPELLFADTVPLLGAVSLIALVYMAPESATESGTTTMGMAAGRGADDESGPARRW